MTLRLALLKRTYFEQYEGWGQECFIETTPLTYSESKELQGLNTDVDEAKGNELVLELVRKHVAGGKVRVLNDDNEQEIVDFAADDLESLAPDMILQLFSDITGTDYDDPKASKANGKTEPK